MIPYTDLKAQYNDAKVEIDDAIKYCIEGNHFITGPVTHEFESVLADYCGVEACASTGSGSTALLCALLACDIGPGDEVITTPHSFVATSEAILQAGARPVFVDIHNSSYNINVDLVEQAITPQTKAILFVDLYGQCPDINKLRDICEYVPQEIYLIEDAAQSFGAEYMNQRVGALVDLTCFSFNPVKTLGAMGDAGAIVGDTYLINKAKQFRDHGRTEKWTSNMMGYNARIDNIQARIVQAKLPFLDGWIKRRQEIAKQYNRELDASRFSLPIVNTNRTHVWYAYVVQVLDRDLFFEYMASHGIACNIHYRIPIHEQPIYSQFVTTPLPVTTSVCRFIVSLPCYHSLTEAQQAYIIDTANRFIG